MVLQLPISHPIIQLAPCVDAICNSFLKHHGFTYFQYLRCYKDGSISLLHNYTKLLMHFIELDLSVLSSYREEHHLLHTYWFFWDEELPKLPVEIARDYHNLYHGVTLVRRGREYYDMIAVALPEPRLNVASFYMSRLKAIEQFIAFFEQEGKTLLQKVIQVPLALPEANQDKNHQQLCLHKKRIFVKGAHGETYLTSQELGCIRLLLQGYTYKEIGRTFNISTRTVETYIGRAKERCGFLHHRQFDKMLSICP